MEWAAFAPSAAATIASCNPVETFPAREHAFCILAANDLPLFEIATEFPGEVAILTLRTHEEHRFPIKTAAVRQRDRFKRAMSSDQCGYFRFDQPRSRFFQFPPRGSGKRHTIAEVYDIRAPSEHLPCKLQACAPLPIDGNGLVPMLPPVAIGAVMNACAIQFFNPGRLGELINDPCGEKNHPGPKSDAVVCFCPESVLAALNGDNFAFVKPDIREF